MNGSRRRFWNFYLTVGFCHFLRFGAEGFRLISFSSFITVQQWRIGKDVLQNLAFHMMVWRWGLCRVPMTSSNCELCISNIRFIWLRLVVNSLIVSFTGPYYSLMDYSIRWSEQFLQEASHSCPEFLSSRLIISSPSAQICALISVIEYPFCTSPLEYHTKYIPFRSWPG